MPGLQVVIKIEAEDEAGEREVDKLFRLGRNLFPVAVLFVDVRTEFFTGGALGTLRVLRLTKPVRLRVNLFDEGERADVVAPCLARVERAEDERGQRNQNKEGRDGVAVAVRGNETHPQREEKD